MARKDEYLQRLGEVPLFRACSKKDLQALAKSGDDIKIDAGKAVVTEGERGHEFYVVIDGKADVHRDGRIVTTLGPGDYFGELALLDPQPRDASVIASTPLELLVISQREFLGLLAEVPTIAGKILAGMARRLHAADLTPGY
ncbi:MAG: family transcriptional regulator, cyclic receptor protein [Actinomycetota bacterium]|jgi:CRP-like cAMP-binding protein|nr:family transcriptional regulator, cyclic receptor protein [Actinomycetota bacterium]